MLVANKADQWWDEQANILWQQQDWVNIKYLTLLGKI